MRYLLLLVLWFGLIAGVPAQTTLGSVQLGTAADLPDRDQVIPVLDAPMLSFRLTPGSQEAVQVQSLTVRDPNTAFSQVTQLHLYTDPSATGAVTADSVLLGTATPGGGSATFGKSFTVNSSQALLVTYAVGTTAQPTGSPGLSASPSPFSSPNPFASPSPSPLSSPSPFTPPSPSPGAFGSPSPLSSPSPLPGFGAAPLTLAGLPLGASLLLLAGLVPGRRRYLLLLGAVALLAVGCGEQSASQPTGGTFQAGTGTGTMQASLSPDDIDARGVTSGQKLTVQGSAVHGPVVNYR